MTTKASSLVGGDCLVKAGQLYSGGLRCVRVDQLCRPLDELPFATAVEIDPGNRKSCGDPFSIALTWNGRAWVMPCWYVEAV